MRRSANIRIGQSSGGQSSGGQSSIGLRPVALTAICWLCCGLLAIGTARGANGEERAQARQAFAEGVEAIELGRYARAVEPLRRAARLDPEESEERVFLSGVFSRPYLPHFHLGLALSKADETQCAEAFEHLRLSEQQGIVQRFDRLFAELDRAREFCARALLPAAQRTAREQVGRASDAADRLEGSDLVATWSAEQRAEHRRALDDLGSARENLQRPSVAADLDQLSSVEALARATAESLEGLAQNEANASTDGSGNGNGNGNGDGDGDDNSLGEAVARASRSITAAERAERQLLDLLADPAYAEAHLAFPELGKATAERNRLRQARNRLDAASAAQEVEQIRAEAEALQPAFETLYRDTLRAFELEGPRLAALRQSTLRTDSPAGRATAPASATANDASPPAGPRPSLVRTLRELLAETEEVLQSLDQLPNAPDAAGDSLLELQEQRAGALRGRGERLLQRLGSGNPPTDRQLEDLRRPLDASLGAATLIGGAHALFAGQPRAALGLLERSAGAALSAPLEAQRHLLRSAAHFQIYRLGGELDPDSRRRSADAAQAGRALWPELEPPNGPFSPTFVAFFEEAQKR